MLIKKLFRTMWQYKSQFISMIIMTTLGIGIFVAFNVEWYTIDENTKGFFAQTGFADFRIIDIEGFSDEDFSKIEKIYGKDKTAKFNEIDVQVENGEQNKKDMLSLMTSSNENVSGFIVNQGEEYDAKDENGLWLCEKYAIANDISLDDELDFVLNGIKTTGTVKGLVQSSEKLICVRDETQLMPDYSSFGYAYISPKMYEKLLGFEYYPQIHIISAESKDEVTANVNNEISNDYIIITKDENISYTGSQGEVQEGQIMGSVLPVLFLLIAVLTMITTMQRLVNKEQVQIGTLKALGFKNRKILIHYTLYAMIVGIIASVLGLTLGYFLAYFIVNPKGAMGQYLDMPNWDLQTPFFTYIVMIGILILLVLIGLFSVSKILKKSACEILRPSLNEKSKPMKIERTKWFHRRSFGTRWNLRDALHHKSRTAMSLVGVVGCMVILMASFGINDTMSCYLDLYYDGAMQYNNKVYLTQDISAEQRDNLIKEYNADWSASLAVKIDDKAYPLDIHNNQNDLVRFIDTKGGFAEIEDNGAYICKRIADEFKLEKGDSFAVSLYDNEDEYTLKVAGVLSSMSENIVILDVYADSIEIPYNISSIYTSKEEVSMQDGIKNIQSKETLISSFNSMLEIMNMMIFMFVVVGLILSVVVLYNLGVMGYTERYREMATLKVLGFRNKKISSLLIGQNLWLSLIGIIIGVPAGQLTLECLLNAMASEYELILYVSSFSYAMSIALNVGVSLLVSLMVSSKNKHIDMVEALKISE